MNKQSNKAERLTLKMKTLWTCKMSGTPRWPTTHHQTTFFCDTFMFCALNITVWQESTQLFHSTTSKTITSVLSPLAHHHTYMFHSFPQYTQKISYYSFPSHFLSTNITQTLVKWKIENYEKNKYSNTYWGDHSMLGERDSTFTESVTSSQNIHGTWVNISK